MSFCDVRSKKKLHNALSKMHLKFMKWTSFLWISKYPFQKLINECNKNGLNFMICVHLNCRIKQMMFVFHAFLEKQMYKIVSCNVIKFYAF